MSPMRIPATYTNRAVLAVARPVLEQARRLDRGWSMWVVSQLGEGKSGARCVSCIHIGPVRTASSPDVER
jgi:hypothetical protein